MRDILEEKNHCFRRFKFVTFILETFIEELLTIVVFLFIYRDRGKFLCK